MNSRSASRSSRAGPGSSRGSSTRQPLPSNTHRAAQEWLRITVCLHVRCTLNEAAALRNPSGAAAGSPGIASGRAATLARRCHGVHVRRVGDERAAGPLPRRRGHGPAAGPERRRAAHRPQRRRGRRRRGQGERAGAAGPQGHLGRRRDPARGGAQLRRRRGRQAEARGVRDALQAGRDDRGRASPRRPSSFHFGETGAGPQVYLGTEKNPSSAHSNAIVYKIKFPGHAHSELDVDVTKTTLSASSDRLKLALYLPQPVHADRGSAKWDDKKKVLTIELPVDVDEW